MPKLKTNKGLSIVESLVCLVLIGIGFIAVSQLTSFAIGSMDRSLERNKVNFLSEMMMDDMMADPGNTSSFASFNESCTYNLKGGSEFHHKQKDKWRDKLVARNQIKVDGKTKVPRCNSADIKKILHKTDATRTSTRVNFLTGKGKNKKYLGVVIK